MPLNMNWLSTIDADNLLAILDVAVDIEKELNISPDKMWVPLWQNFIKFPQLFPVDSIGNRDRYCDLRYKAVAFLQRHDVIHRFELNGARRHRWETQIQVWLDESEFRRAMNMLREEYKRRGGGAEDPSSAAARQPMESVLRVLGRFHMVVTALRRRYSDRSTLDVADEYDVQDLLRALLGIFFDDIRREEWTPSYAGKSSRCDFFLKQQGIVIEVKKTRSGLSEKEIGDQLIIDSARYRTMAGCKKLICFVYDPDERIGNPTGFESDLAASTDDFCVEVFVFPRR